LAIASVPPCTVHGVTPAAGAPLSVQVLVPVLRKTLKFWNWLPMALVSNVLFVAPPAPAHWPRR
jgi:hypothetical protein